MKAIVLLRSPRLWLAIALTTCAVLAWFLSPSLRLRLRGDAPSRIAARAVNAHAYDDLWFDAARAGRTDILSALLDAGYPINATTSSGFTAVILTAYDEQPVALDYLIARGANTCVGDRNGNTALMGALYKGNLDIARRLLRAGCPIDQANNAGETALSFAAMFGRLTFIDILADNGADLAHRDRRGDSASDVARKQGNDESLEALKNAVTRSAQVRSPSQPPR